MSGGTVVSKRAYASITSLSAGTILMILGFFIYIGGNSQVVGVGVVLAGVVFELLGFLLAYLEYKASVKVRGTDSP